MQAEAFSLLLLVNFKICYVWGCIRKIVNLVVTPLNKLNLPLLCFFYFFSTIAAFALLWDPPKEYLWIKN